MLHPSIDLADIRDGGKYNMISTLRSLKAFADGVQAETCGSSSYASEGLQATPVHDTQPKFVIADGVTALDSIKGALSPEAFTAYCKGVALQKIFEGDVDSLAEAATYLNKAVANS
jgi:hypothetical protein